MVQKVIINPKKQLGGFIHFLKKNKYSRLCSQTKLRSRLDPPANRAGPFGSIEPRERTNRQEIPGGFPRLLVPTPIQTTPHLPFRRNSTLLPPPIVVGSSPPGLAA